MRRHPPPDDEKKKRPFAAPTAGPLQTDKISELPPQPGDQATCPPFILSQLTQYDNVSPFLLDGSVVNVIETSARDYIPIDSHGQIPVRIVQTPTKAKMATLAGLMIRERHAKDEADRAGDGDAWLKAMDRLWLLHAEYNNARGIIEHGP